MDYETIIRNYMLYFMLPLWFLPGFLDYLCHRWSSIETTSGTLEAVIHWMFVIEIGIPVLLALFFEINSLVILLMIIAFFVHEATTIWDVVYAVQYRHVSAFEQHIHDYLVVVPLMAVSFVICLRWNQFIALFGAGPEPAHFTLEFKHRPLPVLYLAAIVVGFGFFTILPYTDEFLRCYREAKRVKLKAQQAANLEKV